MKSACIPLLLLPALVCSQTLPEKPFLSNRNYRLQTELYEVYRTDSATVVMLGNSITFGVQWNELMGRSGIVNRGIGSDVTEGFLHRLEYVYRLHPALCCIMGGINDIYNDIPVDSIFSTYALITRELRGHDITPVIQSTLYVSPRWKRAAEKNRDVIALNRLLETYAREEGIDYLDLNDVLSADGVLKDEVTYDGVHLNALGYRLWRDRLETMLKKHSL
ncbi:MAG: GDSL-type esterase/lipase family protein [Ignavibacteria bacterium]|nr:GDSL-type esterase/lipase family protein [Ignavibacteria bacterium]